MQPAGRGKYNESAHLADFQKKLESQLNDITKSESATKAKQAFVDAIDDLTHLGTGTPNPSEAVQKVKDESLRKIEAAATKFGPFENLFTKANQLKMELFFEKIQNAKSLDEITSAFAKAKLFLKDDLAQRRDKETKQFCKESLEKLDVIALKKIQPDIDAILNSYGEVEDREEVDRTAEILKDLQIYLDTPKCKAYLEKALQSLPTTFY